MKEMWNTFFHSLLLRAALTQLPEPVPTMNQANPTIMTDYRDMEPLPLRLKCVARGLEDPVLRAEQVAFLLQDDEKRQEDDSANAALFDSFNDDNDPTYVERINIRQKQLDRQKLRLQTEGDNLVRKHSFSVGIF